ncbi:hypothetical protein LCGC14_1997460 [marine sediment metagenome]|uniref:Uncharacterized protein n=1 Tax=marine sediment metagenome TaxID=412755 RepID=A0A0F9F4E3_9ZZZZ
MDTFFQQDFKQLINYIKQLVEEISDLNKTLKEKVNTK